jgi:hypothetical protein
MRVSTRFVLDGGLIAREVSNPLGATLRRYVYGPGEDVTPAPATPPQRPHSALSALVYEARHHVAI